MKKSATLTAIVISMILAIGIFIGMFTWLNTNASDSGVLVDSIYPNVESNLSAQSTNLKTYFDGIKTDLSKVGEAESIYSVAINGFKGVGKILLSPIKIVDYVLTSYLNIKAIIEIPEWIRLLVEIGLLAVILLVIVATVKGEQSKI